MKRTILIVALLLSSFAIKAQEQSGFDKFLKQIWFPTEFGLSMPSGDGMNSGMVTRIALEWRQTHQEGIFASINYDTRYNSYTDKLPGGTNLTDADVDFNDIYLGAGYRVKLSDSFCVALSVHGGVSICAYQSIVPSSYTPTSEETSAADFSLPPYYAFERTSATVPAVKVTSFFEYYLDPKFCVFLTAGYVQHLSLTPFASTLAKEGSVLFSLGFTAAIF